VGGGGVSGRKKMFQNGGRIIYKAWPFYIDSASSL